jgi:DNA helicase-2/ATP-dependent DNA helicase PcrA
MAYLRLVNQPADDLAFERIVNTPRRGIGTATLQLLHGAARQEGLSLVEATRGLISGDKLPRGARNALANFLTMLDRWRDEAERDSHVELVQRVLDESGYTGMWQADPSPEAPGRLENLKELVVAMAEFENLGGFFEHVSLVMDNAADNGSDMVNLMTLHSAKGLEFDTVFLPGWEEGVFPSQRAIEESGLPGLEEERRLAYVGITRAEQRLYLTRAVARSWWGRPEFHRASRFLSEIPGQLIEWRRDEAAAAPPAMERTAQRPGISSPGNRPVPALAPGDMVNHDKFGLGTVIMVDGAGGDRAEAKIDFGGDYGVKHLVLRYAPLEKL